MGNRNEWAPFFRNSQHEVPKFLASSAFLKLRKVNGSGIIIIMDWNSIHLATQSEEFQSKKLRSPMSIDFFFPFSVEKSLPNSIGSQIQT